MILQSWIFFLSIFAQNMRFRQESRQNINFLHLSDYLLVEILDLMTLAVIFHTSLGVTLPYYVTIFSNLLNASTYQMDIGIHIENMSNTFHKNILDSNGHYPLLQVNCHVFQFGVRFL